MKAHLWFKTVFCGSMLLAVSLACSLPGRISATPAGRAAPLSQPALAREMTLNGADLEGISVNAGNQTFGPILSIQVTNPKTEEVMVTIPCGLIFKPASQSGEQALMVILENSELIPAGETGSLEPYVICIESSSSIPEESSTYEVGTIATGNLYDLAACICQDKEARDELQNPLGFQDQLGIQLAVWLTADNISVADAPGLMQEEGGALGELSQVLAPVMETITSLAEKWLDRCGITISE